MLEEEELTYKIRGCVFEVYKELGAGFLEKVYENALMVELLKQSVRCKPQHCLRVRYKGTVVGEYLADILIEDRVIIELKAVNKILPRHEAQLLNYLKATNIKVGLLVNFTYPKATVKRYVLS
jgi:GxxExxY protein